MPRLLVVASCMAIALLARSEEPAAPHKGAWLDVPGATGKFEVVVAKDKKSATVYSFDKDGKTPLGLKDAPELTLPVLDEKNPVLGKALNLKDGVATEFEFKVPVAGDGDLVKDHPPNLGPHGGSWIDVPGSRWYMEYIHDVKTGRVTVWIFGEDGKTPVPLAEAPVFNVDTPLDGMVQLDGKAVGLKEGRASRFDFEGADLSERPPGGGSRFALKIDSKPFQAPLLNREHGHMHGPGGVAMPK